MKIIAKSSKSLLSQTSSKSKKVDKYNEVSSIVKEYEFSIDDRVIFLGLVSDYRGLECKIIKRTMKKKTTDYYSVKFDDGNVIESVVYGFLRTPEQYELEIEEQKNKNEDDHSDLPEIELEMIKNGIESHKNYHACLSPLNFHYMDCDSCTYKSKCVYENKFDYKKAKFN